MATPTPTNQKPKVSQKRYNWELMRAEFIQGDWETLGDYVESKGFPRRFANKKGFNGIVAEKKKMQKDILMRSAEKSLEADIGDLTKVRLRQARLARYLQLRGAEALKDSGLKISTADDARKLLVSGLQEERRALGLEGGGQAGGGQNITQINIGVKTNLDRELESMSYEQVLELIGELKRRGAGSNVPKAVEAGTDKVTEGEIL